MRTMDMQQIISLPVANLKQCNIKFWPKSYDQPEIIEWPRNTKEGATKAPAVYILGICIALQL